MAHSGGGARSYDDPCGVARALDLVGERWALLVVRELLLGPKRYTDLRAGLPSISQNVLSQRLRELERSGVVRRRKLDPPAAAWVYELTEWGAGLEPVLFHLARWGSRGPMTSGAELSADALMLALRTTVDTGVAAEVNLTLELRLGEDRFRAQVRGGRLDLVRGGADQPDAVVTTDSTTLRSVVFGTRSLADAVGVGDLTIQGDQRAVVRFADLFERPAPHPDACRGAAV